MLTRFLPKNERFFELFEAAAKNALEMATAFYDLVEHFENVEAKVKRIRELEREGDAVAHRVSSGLQQTFITPLDREDIVMLSEKIDDFVDAIEDAARKLWLYRVSAPTEPTRKMASIILEQAKILVEAIPLAEDNKHTRQLLEKASLLKKLEDDADDINDGLSAAQFDTATDIPSLINAIRWGELYQHLEDATDRAQDVANALESIALKNA